MESVTHLVAIESIYSELELKEFIDIAMVSSAYEVTTMLYMDISVINRLNEGEFIKIQQAIMMLKDFSIPIYSNQSGFLFETAVTCRSLDLLKSKSKHHFIFSK